MNYKDVYNKNDLLEYVNKFIKVEDFYDLDLKMATYNDAYF